MPCCIQLVLTGMAISLQAHNYDLVGYGLGFGLVYFWTYRGMCFHKVKQSCHVIFFKSIHKLHWHKMSMKVNLVIIDATFVVQIVVF